MREQGGGPLHLCLETNNASEVKEQSVWVGGVGVRDGRKSSGMVWHGMVWCGLVGSAVGDHPLAPCASVRTFMRGPFVPGRQAHQ